MDRRHPRKPPVRPLVLIVGRHQDTRELYTAGLPPLGFDVMTAADRADGYKQAWGSRPDLIVSDVVPGHRDGWALLGDLKGDPRTRDIPVVVVTGDGQPHVRARAACEGAAAVIVKPCLPEDLALELRQVLMPQTSHEPASAGT